MPTLTTGAVKSMKLPEAFSEHSKQIGGMGGDNWAHSYRRPGHKFPEITMRYSGFPLYGPEVEPFRDLLSRSPQVIFESGNPQFSGVANQDLARRVSPSLGNSGDNQLSNDQTGIDGPMFHLQKMEVCLVSNRSVLRIHGWFHAPGEEEAKVYLNCLFIDADPASKECRREELYLQAFPEDLFEQHLADFEQVLASIKWSN